MSDQPHNPYDHGPDHHAGAPSVENEILERAIRELLVEKGVVAPDVINKFITIRESFTHEPGARLAARMWVDPAFKARALEDGRAACDELGINLGPFDLKVWENTPRLHHVVVCTLCSCFATTVLGNAPAWYKGREYRSRVAQSPRAVLCEFGTAIADDVEVRVVDSTAEIRNMVLPLRPAGTEHLDEAALARLITQDNLIGVTLVQPPEQA
jgi:nitrile hydratase